MKKIFICLLVLTMFLTGCSQFYENETESNDSDSVSIEEADNNYDSRGVSDTSDYNISDCEAPGWFRNLSDFYKFATSGSRNPEDYVDSYTSENIYWYRSIDSDALLKIEDLFSDPDIANEVEEVWILYRNNCYSYELKSGVSIDVDYTPLHTETMADIVRVGDPEFVQEDNQTKFSIASQDGKIYFKEVNGITVYRQMKNSFNENHFKFDALIDGHKITIYASWTAEYSSQEQFLNDPGSRFVGAFLNDSELPDAIEILKACIDKKQK